MQSPDSAGLFRSPHGSTRTVAPPAGLRADGLISPLGLGAQPPLLSWALAGPQKAIQVEVEEERSGLGWRSGTVESTVPELRYQGAQLSRGRYRWRVRIRDAAGTWSDWSEEASFEFGITSPEEWRASWIARPVPRETRTIRSLSSNLIDWVTPGHRIGQVFTSTGPVSAISADLVAELNDDVRGRLEMRDTDENVVGALEFEGVPFVWDRFSRFIEFNPPAPPGTYLVELISERGRTGWRTSTSDIRAAAPDDGVSPLPVVGPATRDELRDRGTRALGVETIAAPNPVLRTTFEVESISSARLHGVGLGYGIFRINGRVVGEEVLDPAPTAYDETVLVRTWDVGDLLVAGENVLSIELGRGFFAARGASNWGWNLSETHTEPVAIAQLEIEDRDAGLHVICTDGSWEAATSDVVVDALYAGEHQSSSAPEWGAVVCVSGPGGRLKPASIPPILRHERVDPAAVTAGPHSATYDFGVTLSGWVRCCVAGKPGDTVTIRYGESLDDEGQAHCDNELAVGSAQVDVIELHDTHAVEWEPRFGYRGFRYATVICQGAATATAVEAVRVHTAAESIGSVSCEDDTLTWIAQATERTFLNNLHGVPTDTPIYEKNGWTADAHLVSESIMLVRDMRSTFQKWLDDHVDAQDELGVIPQIVPTPGWGSDPDPAWSASLALIAWDLYWETGDVDVLQRYIEPIRRYTDRMLHLAASGLWTMHSWGDWLSPGHTFAPETGTPTATMMLHQVTRITARMCEALGDHGAARRYLVSAASVAEAYHREYFDEDAQHYRVPGLGYRQTMNVLPLAFGIPPAHARQGVAHSLIQDIEQRTGGFHDTGALGLKYLLPVLSDFGRTDLAITLATQASGPSWGAWHAAGHTTLLESWDEDVRSHNHYFLGAATAWVTQRVVGVRSTKPGWEEIDVQPVIDPRVSWGRMRHRSVRGEVAVEWAREADRVRGRVQVPNGSTARVGTGTGALILNSGADEFEIEVPALGPAAVPHLERTSPL